MRIYAVIAGIFALTTVTATATPPAPGTEDAELMAPYSGFFKTLRSPQGFMCCDVSDCRIVEARIANDHWQVFITRRQFPTPKDEWVDVPPSAVIQKRDNPTGQPVVCWSPFAGVRCFLQASGV